MKNIILAERWENEDLRMEFTYHNDWRYSMLTDTSINVYGPYEILEDQGKKYIVSSNCKEDFEEGYRGFMDTNIEVHSHYFLPFKVENLLFEALKVDIETEKSILKFCNQYGVLGEYRQKAAFDELELTGVNECGWLESLEFFKTELTQLKECFELYQMATDEKEKKENIIKAKGLLLHKVNKKLPNTFLSLRMTENGDIIEGITSFTLIGALYYQLYQHIVKGSQFNICKHCGNYFVPRKSDSNFCPAEEANKHSKCANAYNAMKKRARKWHFEDKLTAEEIQLKIKIPRKRSIMEIKGWLK